MTKTQKRLTGFLTNTIIAFVIAITAMSTIIDPVAVQTANVVNDVVYSGNTDNKNVSLMINVYWGTEYLEDILKAFKDANMTTTFFVGGSWAIQNKDMLKKIKAAGHEIGSHGYNHKDHDKISREENYNEIYNTHGVVKEILGIDMTLFAPPSGAYNKTTVDVAKSLGYTTIMWTRDTIDWRDKDSHLVYTRAVNNIKGGDLILMHPTAHTRDALPKILKEISSNGLSCSPVSKTIQGIEL